MRFRKRLTGGSGDRRGRCHGAGVLERVGLLLAECANGHFFAHGDFTFVNGTELHGDVVKPCTPKG